MQFIMPLFPYRYKYEHIHTIKYSIIINYFYWCKKGLLGQAFFYAYVCTYVPGEQRGFGIVLTLVIARTRRKT